jgi:uncharacterized protein YfkK (UPF0435 family)
MIKIMDENELIEKVQRQTNYSLEEAREKLKQHNNDILKVIKEYLGITDKIETCNSSTNQMIYKEIRKKINIVNHDYQK